MRKKVLYVPPQNEITWETIVRIKSIFLYFKLARLWFSSLISPKTTIVYFSRVRLDYLLPFYSFCYSFKSSPFYTLHIFKANCDICHVLIYCPSHTHERTILFSKHSYYSYYSPDQTFPFLWFFWRNSSYNWHCIEYRFFNLTFQIFFSVYNLYNCLIFNM